MKKVLSLLALMFVSSAHAGVITTTFAANNNQSGNMFDVVNLTNDFNITGLDLNLDIGTWDIEIYSKSGSWVGFDTDASAWSLVDTGTVDSAGENLPTFFDVTDFLLDGFATTALYITTTVEGGIMNYTNGSGVGNVFVDNGELQILEGAGKAYAFDATFQPRVWNGTIYYENAVSVPEPGSLALFGLGLAGLGFVRKRQLV